MIYEGKGGITAEVIAHSITEDAPELLTLRLEYPRFIHSEYMTHRTFCLDGDSMLEFDLPSGASDGKSKKVYHMKIRDFVKKWHKGSKGHKASRFKPKDLSCLKENEIYTAKEISKKLGYSSPSNIRSSCRSGALISENPLKTNQEDYLISGKNFKSWQSKRGYRSFSLRDRLKKMKIRQLNEDTGFIESSTVNDCCYSGEKEVFEVKSKCGKYKVTGSLNHRIMTNNGWKKIKELQPEFDFMVVKSFGKKESDKADPNRLRKINGKWRSRFQIKQREKKISQGLKCEICNENNIVDIHHVIPVYKNPSLAFNEENVIGVCDDCHNKKHKTQGWQGGTYLYGGLVKIGSIKSVGFRDTYDLEISGKYANFLANGVVVHNSRNAASSRAIPVVSIITEIQKAPAIPIHWGKNQRGMQAEQEISKGSQEAARQEWLEACQEMIARAYNLDALGVHKQVVNRLLEPFMFMQVIMTSCKPGLNNFMNLRNHKDAQPEIEELAKMMDQAIKSSDPRVLNHGDWHMPFVDWQRDLFGDAQVFTDEKGRVIPLEAALKISCSANAQVSFRKNDLSIEKAERIHNMLVSADVVHASPFEHIAQAKPPEAGQESNLIGWTQYRKTIKNEFNGVWN